MKKILVLWLMGLVCASKAEAGWFKSDVEPVDLLSSPWVGIHSVSRKEAQKPQKMNTIRLIAYLAHFCGKKHCRANQELISIWGFHYSLAQSPHCALVSTYESHTHDRPACRPSRGSHRRGR
jgi:hypothetical protein